MEPILNEHEVIKFLVSKGGRCTNFELVSNFRGVLNDPHCKAEARLRFKDIINTVATVGEFQNVKYIELKKEHSLNNGMDSPQPSSLDTGYTSPLTQNFQPYWRYRLSTSKQLLPPPRSTPDQPSSPPRSLPSFHRSMSEYPHGYRTTPEDQVVPRTEDSPDWESGQEYQSLPFYPNVRVGSEPRSSSIDHRRYSSDGLRQIGQQDVRLQQFPNHQPVGYQHPEHQSDRYQPPKAGYLHPEQIYDGYSSQHKNHVSPKDARLSLPGYQYPENKPPNYQQQLRGNQHLSQQHPGLAGDIRMQETRYQYSDFRPAGYQHSEQLQHAGRQSQYPIQETARYQPGEEHATRHSSEKQTGVQNIYKFEPDQSIVHRSSSVRRFADSAMESQDVVLRTKPEPSIARKIESLHGIHHSESVSSYSSLPYESPSAYHLSDISPHGRNDLGTEDLQTSANLRNVARALFKDPVRSSRRSDATSPRQNTLNDINSTNSNNVKRSQRSQSSPSHAGYVEDGNMYFGSSNGRQDHKLPKSSGPNRSTEYSANSHSSPIRSVSMERVTSSDSMSSSSTDRLVSRGSSDLSMDYSNSSSTLNRPGDNELSPTRVLTLSSSTVIDTKRFGSNDISSKPSSISSSSNLDCEKELSNVESDFTLPESKCSVTTPPPLPPDRRKKTESDDKNDDNGDNKVLESVSCSGGKVKDRVQHFDDMEKRRNTKRTHSPLLSKENRTTIMHKGIGVEDDVSISVIEPKLKREWFVKAAQCDYHALTGLLKKEPKLAAIKDPAMTSLHWAAKQGDANVVKLIAGAFKVNPNIRSGYTPVHLATLYKHDMIVHLLVHTYGADASIRDYSGKRADQYPNNYVKVVAGHNVSERRPLKPERSAEPQPKETSVGNSFMRIGSLNLRKSSRKSTVFASVRGSTRNWGSASELRIGGHSMRKKLHKNMIPAHEKIGEKKNDSDSDSTYGFPSKKQN